MRIIPWKDEIKIVYLDSRNVFLEYIDRFVEAYRLVFGGPEWKEWKICLENNHKFSFLESKDLSICPKCSSKLVYYWPPEQVTGDLTKAYGYPDSIFLIAVLKGKVIGFTFGYCMDRPRAFHHFDNHLPYKLRSLIKSDGNHFWYQSDIGVVPDHQGKHLAAALYKERMKIALEQTKHNIFIIRSQPGAKTYHWYRNRVGYLVLSKYYRPELQEWRYLLHADRRTIRRYVYSS